MFGLYISLIPFHYIFLFFSTFLILQTIPFHFFSIIFFNFPNPYTISLNLNHSYHLEISKIKSFLHHFSKLFSNHFFHPNKWDGMGKMPTPNKGLFCNNRKNDALTVCLVFYRTRMWLPSQEKCTYSLKQFICNAKLHS